MKNSTRKSGSGKLRQKSLNLLEKRHGISDDKISEANFLSLKQEIAVHQIELELQHEELIQARFAAQERAEKFTELFDFAPSGYFSLSDSGIIIELNHNGALLLGAERALLLEKRFDLFVSDETKPAFEEFFKKVFTSDGKVTCEVTLSVKKSEPVFVFVTGVVSDDGTQCLVNLIDITEYRHMSEALKESEDEFRQMVRDMQVGVVLQNSKSEILLCNPKALELLGIDEDQLLGKTSFDLDWNVIHEDGSPFPGVEHPVPVAIATRRPVREVVMGVFQPKKGTRVWLLVYAEPQLNSDGAVRQVVCTFTDISRRKEAEDAEKKLNEELEDRVRERTSELQISYDAIEQSKEKYRTVADFTNDWEFWLDQNDIFRYCSPSCARITGYTASAFIQNPRLLLDIIHPDDLDSYLYHKKKEKVAEEANQEIQYRIIRLDGTIRWIGHVCQPVFNNDGNYIGIRGGNRDISERKEMEELLKISERKYKLLSENVTDGIFICRNGYLEYFNDAMSRIFGYEYGEMSGLRMSQLVKPEYRNDLESCLHIHSPQNQAWNIEIECLTKNYKTVYIEIQINYVANEGLVYGVVHDITDKKHIQKNIVKAIIQTEEKERAYFSKELHDGLGPLLSLTKLYMQWTLRPKSNKALEDIIHKAEGVIDEALAAVKEISNKLSPHILSSYGLTSAIQSFIVKLEETSTIKINFVSNLNRRLDMEIEAALYRAVIECINNTMKYARANNISILLNDEDSLIQLDYRDDGIGYNLTETPAREKGLGLFNLQNRIETIGGKITLCSIPGKGVDYQILVNL